jgi:tetratricopeptide (TPR) repeat protein/peroxiredoxin
LRKVEPGSDGFINEKYAAEVEAILGQWGAALLRGPREVQAIAQVLAPSFLGSSLRPIASRVVRSGSALEVRTNEFAAPANLHGPAFLEDWQAAFGGYAQIEVAEFQITRIESTGSQSNSDPLRVDTRVRYEIVGAGTGFHRQQQVGNWRMRWESSRPGEFLLTSLGVLDQTQARSTAPVYSDITASALGGNVSYSAQMLHGTDYWRTVLDGASGIDVYGHNGVSVADIDNDGLDDLYVCQPAGLPNRLYRNRGDGTFADVTESSGLGILENTACALFADFNNDGLQDVILVRANGPLLFENRGGGKFQQKREAFQFANAPQGTFTGAAVADYDRDGWLDVYFCLYAFYQGTGQYRYPSPYRDAENGPPNFLMRNNRDGSFRDVTAESGMNRNNSRYSFCCGWNDYNRDGWPDLYVVNDFGRKNLYRNNGDGTFTDVASAARVEDVGAGMSVSWRDFDNDGADDLYVANMWTAAGLRVSTQDGFRKDSPAPVRALFQKHAMGNSLLDNGGCAFADATDSSGTRIGRWAWSSDAFDFDHDGYADLYIANGMISGPARADLNSFFWRQVVANSPDEAGAARDYEQGWNAINELIRSDETWSGYERNILYANNRDGTFSDVSAAVGLGFIEDGRSFAVADFDGDGRLEICLKNRNAPQLRVLKNFMEDLPPSVSFRLRGTNSNRDAIGAVITVDTGAYRQRRSLEAGSGFLSQHSKEVFFGLGEAKGAVRASIRWPSGLVQELHNLPINHRIWVQEGEGTTRAEPFRRAAQVSGSSQPQSEVLRTQVETWLLAPVPAPEFSLPDLTGAARTLSALRGKIVLLNFWTTQSPACVAGLEGFEKNRSSWEKQGWHVAAVNLDDLANDSARNERRDALDDFVRRHHWSIPIVRGSADVAAVYNILHRQLFDRHRDMVLPTSFLIDRDGNIVKVYQGPLDIQHVDEDFAKIPKTDDERLTLALPFPRGTHGLEFGRNYLSLGTLFFQRGYLDEAAVWFQQALRDDPSSAEAQYGIGSVYLNQNNNAAARDAFERSVKLQASYPDTLPDAWNNLGVIATREGRVQDSVGYFERALGLSPNHLLSLDNLGNAYRAQKQWEEARRVLERALRVAPGDAEANYSLGMVYAQTGDTGKAYEYLQKALQARPNYPEALNNLGVLYLVMQRRDDAVASFEQCIRGAPGFDQAYLNLARVYALEGSRDKARGVLEELLEQHPGHPEARQMLEQLR